MGAAYMHSFMPSQVPYCPLHVVSEMKTKSFKNGFLTVKSTQTFGGFGASRLSNFLWIIVVIEVSGESVGFVEKFNRG